MSNSGPLIALVGATATGKTDLAIALAQALRGEVINADAMQFYRGMDIGTAKVTPEERGDVAHHLLDIYTLDVEANVATFQAQARQKIAEIRSRGKTPILTGGSGLYVRAVLDTIEFPPTDHQLRQQLTLEAKQLGTGHLVKELQRVDPDAAQRLKDDRRIIRAVEVYRLTGKPFSSYMPTRMYHQSIPPVIQVGLITERSQLHKRIEQRVYTMMATGWVDEVKRLMVQGLAEAPTASRAIGYRQIMEYIQGKISKEAAIESTIIATRKFARRQETWFKADPRVHWIDTATTNLVAETLQLIEAS